MLYSGEKYEFLFNSEIDVQDDAGFGEARELLRHSGVALYRTKTITSGLVREVEIYPVYDSPSAARAAKANQSRQAQQNQNEKNAKKALIRKINANFNENDLHVTLTYKDKRLPNEAEALKDIRNFIRRVRSLRKREKLPELKYVYVIEYSDGDRRRVRVHHHVIMSGGLDRKAIKALWPHGIANIDELEPEDGSLEGLARYITKPPGGIKRSKRWQASRNLKKPKVTISDTKVSKRQVERMALDMEEAAPTIFGNLFADYDFVSCDVKRSDFVAGAYVYAKMHKPPLEKKPRRAVAKKRERGE